MKDFFEERRPHDGLAYDEYLAEWRAENDLSPSLESKDERRRQHYVRYNYERSERVHQAYEPSAKLREAVQEAEKPQLWMVLTENWCGDSAYLLPVIAEAAQLSDRIELRILPRDDNLDIMDQYLTGESRSVPKLVAFNEEGGELFQWGPRPEGARRLFSDLRAEEHEKEEVVEQLIAHYEEGGWQEADAELAEALTQAEGRREPAA